jgi:hypothetical protein
LIAHRAGNEARLIGPALAVTDTIEVDVHRFRGKLEVRHAKAVWPFRVYWERWERVRTTEWHEFGEIAEHTPEGAHLWVDLKGFSRRLTRRVLDELGDRRPVTVSCRAWWLLPPARRADSVRTFRSVGTQCQLWLVQRLRFAAADDGVVMHHRLATTETLVALRRLTPHVVVWGVDDLDRARNLVEMGVTGIIADDLQLLEELKHLLDRGTPRAD